MDTLSTAARAVVPLLLAAEPGSPRAAAAMELMRKWDYRMQRDRPEPLIYAAWLRHLMQAIAEDELGPLFDDYGRSRPGFVIAVLTRNRHWCDDVTTPAKEDCAARIALALERALDEIAARQGEDIARWRWGDVHRAALVNRVLAHVPLVGRFANLVVATDGGNDTVNRGLMAESGANPFAHAHGAGFRAVYDLSDLARSRFVIATGQSGNPLSPHYGDMVERWRDGGHVTIATDKEAARRRAVSTLVITPK
jgi:penicillin amidase